MKKGPKYEIINWSGYEWKTSERWGFCHPVKKHWWYDSSQVNIDKDGVLHLKTAYNPQYINEEVGVSDIGVGLISSTGKFGYGIYEIEAKLPKGKYLWPAFWIWSWESWPPEIDIFEAYSNHSKYFFNNKILEWFKGKFWKIESNIHLLEDKKNTSIGALSSFFTFRNPSKNFIKYKLIWTEKLICIYYNDKLHRKIEDPKILNNLKGHEMNIIINNGITDKIKNYKNVTQSDFQIKYFKYTKI
jgi:beta-glucanase (GH16 family)